MPMTGFEPLVSEVTDLPTETQPLVITYVLITYVFITMALITCVIITNVIITNNVAPTNLTKKLMPSREYAFC